MSLIEVNNKKSIKEFHKLAKKIYKNDPYWVCPMEKEIENIFDPESNPEFKNGDAKRWILYNEEGESIGRIAAFYNEKKARVYEQKTGGCGFFECINNQKAANMLFDEAKQWLQAKGMEAMNAPVNFGENDSHWGLLVDGFMQQGIGMPYHHPYYKELFEQYGFKNFFEQYSYHKDLTNVNSFPERFEKISTRLANRPGYHFEHLNLNNLEKYIHDLVYIYNSAWKDFKEDYTEMDPNEIRKSFKNAKAIIDESLIWFAYHNNEPIAFFILFPDFHQIQKHLNGKLNLIGILKFLYYKHTRKINRIRALVAGVSPNYRNTGIESAIFKHLFNVFKRKPNYKELELSWVGDYNPKMRSIYEAIGAKHVKTHITYRFLFNEKIPFKRFME